MSILWFILGFVLFGEHASEAACSGSSPTWTAASAGQTDLIDCITAATSGDTINIPSGSGTWAYPALTKEVTLQGAGAGNTVITCNPNCLLISSAVTTRVTGFTFSYSGSSDVSMMFVGKGYTPGTGKTFRLDHNTFTSATAWGDIEVYGTGPSVGLHTTGLFDHNTFHNVAVKVFGTDFLRTEGPAQDNLWSQTTRLGGGTEVVYIEDNTFTADTTAVRNAVDGNHAGRYVVRFNTISNLVTGIEIHSVQGNNRAVQRWEIYNNSISNPQFTSIFARGGTGVIFGNRTTDAGLDVVLDNVRSQQDVGAPAGACVGTSNWDQNIGAIGGYACRDQIGRSHDTVTWVPGNAYTQVLAPAYFWDNMKGTTPVSATTPFTFTISTTCGGAPCVPAPGNSGGHIVQNRDWFNMNPSFTGTTGVGVGSLAARPSTCATNVAYWATDQGEWNSLQLGPDGQLYKCTALNTWTVHYTPYTYPHPLQGVVSGNGAGVRGSKGLGLF